MTNNHTAMKKQYFTPRIEFFSVEIEPLMAQSLAINNNPQNNVAGDVKEDDWGNIWDDSSFEE